MRNVVTKNKSNLLNNQSVNAYRNLNGISEDFSGNNAVSDILAAEGCEYFLQYIEEAGLADDPDVLVLSSQHHYYYDQEEMKNIRTVINLKELNQIRDIKGFLKTIFQLLPINSNFVGCFVDNRKFNVFEVRNISSDLQNKTGNADLEENGIISRVPFLNMIYSFMDLRTNKYISSKGVYEMLEETGFVVVKMEVNNGLTFFHSRKTLSE